MGSQCAESAHPGRRKAEARVRQRACAQIGQSHPRLNGLSHERSNADKKHRLRCFFHSDPFSFGVSGRSHHSELCPLPPVAVLSVPSGSAPPFAPPHGRAAEMSVFAEGVENRFHDATQKFRQFDRIKFHAYPSPKNLHLTIFPARKKSVKKRKGHKSAILL